MTDSDEFRKSSSTGLFGRTVVVLDETDSTNARARDLAEKGAAEGTVVLAHHQTAGRGRLGRTWSSAPGENLLFSVVLRPDMPPRQSILLTFGAAVAVAGAVEEVTGLAPQTRWPNDLLLDGRKFCGILFEAVSGRSQSSSIVAGIGINVNQVRFPDFPRRPATSLRLAIGRPVDRPSLFGKVLERLELAYTTLKNGREKEILDDWRGRCGMFNQRAIIGIDGSEKMVTVLRLADDGGLVVDDCGVARTVYAADVSNP